MVVCWFCYTSIHIFVCGLDGIGIDCIQQSYVAFLSKFHATFRFKKKCQSCHNVCMDISDSSDDSCVAGGSPSNLISRVQYRQQRMTFYFNLYCYAKPILFVYFRSLWFSGITALEASATYSKLVNEVILDGSAQRYPILG